MASALDSMAAAMYSSWETITPRLMTSNPASVKAWYRMLVAHGVHVSTDDADDQHFLLFHGYPLQIMLLAGGYNGDGIGTGEYSVMQDYYVFTEVLYPVFPGCQGPEENIYSSSGKFHTVSWQKPSAQHLGNGLAAPGNALGDTGNGLSPGLQVVDVHNREACLAQLYRPAPAAADSLRSPSGLPEHQCLARGWKYRSTRSARQWAGAPGPAAR